MATGGSGNERGGRARDTPTPIIMELRVDSEAGSQGQWSGARRWSGSILVLGLTDSGDLEW